MIEKVILAKPRGFCAGVVMAIHAVKKAAQSQETPLTVYHSIVHNHTVVNRLRSEHNVQFIEDLSLESLPEKGDTLVFSAHGVSPAVRKQADELGLYTIDATCPLVTKVHTEAKKYAREGYHILLVGDSFDHQEVVGTYGEAPHCTTVVGVLGKQGEKLMDPHTVTVPNPEKVVVLTQTTLSVDDTFKTIDILKRRFPNLLVPPSDDLCYATKNRQDAVKNIAPHVDTFLVVTSLHSSNGMRLFELAETLVGRAYRLETWEDLHNCDLRDSRCIGITSAASTPDDLVMDIVKHFQQLNPNLDVVEEGEWEDIEFREAKKKPPSAISG
ncbi:MAG: 4-hydroxy-3-methylbut-2-enyl diphosphate reductase [Deinococcaceae bacterium]